MVKFIPRLRAQRSSNLLCLFFLVMCEKLLQSSGHKALQHLKCYCIDVFAILILSFPWCFAGLSLLME